MTVGKFSNLFQSTNFRFCARSFFRGENVHEPPAFSVVFPQATSPQLDPKSIPESVSKPTYYESGDPGPGPTVIDIKNDESIAAIRRSCRLAKQVLAQCEKIIQPGITTESINDLVTELSFKAGAYPSPLNYRHFPKSVCTSVNNCVCHGIPDSRPLENGDIINVDVTVYLDGFHGDCSETFQVGSVDDKGLKLLQISRECLYIGIEQCGPGNKFLGIGQAIEKHAKKNGLNVVPVFTGHGIGTYFHGPPDIYHCRNSYPGVMKPGMVFTIEPAIAEGLTSVRVLSDGWTAVTRDGSRSAQFEHTVLITDTGVEILTEHEENNK